MKKLLLLAAVAALTMNVTLWGQSITVTSPAPRDEWCLGSTYTITWIKSGALPATVGVRLRRAGAPETEPSVLVITPSTANNGSLSWTIPASVPAGRYFIRINTTGPLVIGDSALFGISVPPPAAIYVTALWQGNEWCLGSTHMITWTKSCAVMSATVGIRLRRVGAPQSEPSVLIITPSTANNGSLSWTIPDSVPVGDYFIRISTTSPVVIGDSPGFKITACYMRPRDVPVLYPKNRPIPDLPMFRRITVTSPAAVDEWCLGSSHTITWIKSGVLPATVFVRLRRAGAPETESAVVDITGSAGTANDGSLNWTIPASLPAGDYFIRVRTNSPDVIGDGPNFKIKSCQTGQIYSFRLSPQYKVQIGSPLDAYVTGTGKCDALSMNWGDGSPSFVVKNANFDILPGHELYVGRHMYYEWGGSRTMTAEASPPCVGKVQAKIIVEPTAYKFTYYPEGTTSACYILDSMPKVRKNSIVTITNGPAKIDFGCLFGGCVYGPNGEPNSVAPADYPFPGKRKYSLVIRLGSQVEQGSDISFVANQTAKLEVCANDNNPGDNSGAWEIFIEVDESKL